jgi:hypothetical protein
MRAIFIYIAGYRHNRVQVLLIYLLLNSSLYAQHPLPVLPDTSQLGRYTSRTMHLLHFSAPEHRNIVRILVYGQSISEQKWWLEVKRAVKERFPNADIIMENKAIGGFSTQYLFKTVEMDVGVFYPDLVLLHIYGNNNDYEKVLRTIRSRTSAEVAIMTDHYTGENRWSDTMSYHILPALAEKYKCDIINIRDPWKRYLKDNNLEAKALLRDEVHLNDFGNYLMAELVKPLFCYKSSFGADPFGLLSAITKESGMLFHGDTIFLPFSGNRADIIFDTSGFLPDDSLEVLLDGKVPSSYQGTYYLTRPSNSKGDSWPWRLPAMIRIAHTNPWIDEDWTCVFTHANPPYRNFRFKVYGSITGYDGHRKATRDFVSKSGRVIIKKGDAEDGGDWHLNRSYRVLKTVVNSGDSVNWKTFSISTDFIKPVVGEGQDTLTEVILFQGVPNTGHTLSITGDKQALSAIKEVLIYRPYWDR